MGSSDEERIPRTSLAFVIPTITLTTANLPIQIGSNYGGTNALQTNRSPHDLSRATCPTPRLGGDLRGDRRQFVPGHSLCLERVEKQVDRTGVSTRSSRHCHDRH